MIKWHDLSVLFSNGWRRDRVLVLKSNLCKILTISIPVYLEENPHSQIEQEIEQTSRKLNPRVHSKDFLLLSNNTSHLSRHSTSF